MLWHAFMSRLASSVLLACTLFAAAAPMAACAEAPPPQPGPPATLATTNVRETCPLGVQNAHVRYDDTSTGATLVFDTTPERLDELRRRVQRASELHGPGKHTGEGHDGQHGLGRGQHGLQTGNLPPSHAAFANTEDGARLTFTPDRPEDLTALRNALRYRVERMMARCAGQGA